MKKNILRNRRRMGIQGFEKLEELLFCANIIDLSVDTFLQDMGYGPIDVEVGEAVDAAFVFSRKDLSGCTPEVLEKQVSLEVPNGSRIYAPEGAQEVARTEVLGYTQVSYLVFLADGESVTFQVNAPVPELRAGLDANEFMGAGIDGGAWGPGNSYFDPDILNGAVLVNRAPTENGLIKTDVFHASDWSGFSANADEVLRLDANRDGRVAPGDVLLVINALNAQNNLEGGGAVAIDADESELQALDVNGDEFITWIDALQIINDINAQESCVAAHQEATDAIFAEMGS